MQTPEFGDCVAVESGAGLESDVGLAPRGGGLNRRQRRLSAAHREFPPPISWLATTADLQSDVPWVMKKYSTSDGRLVIKEERVTHHDYFLADRSNGRLVLNLVHVDDVVEENGNDCDDGAVAAEEEEEAEGDVFAIADTGDCADKLNGGSTVEDVASECYKYNGIGMGINPCGGSVAAAAAAAVVLTPPVHI